LRSPTDVNDNHARTRCQPAAPDEMKHFRAGSAEIHDMNEDGSRFRQADRVPGWEIGDAFAGAMHLQGPAIGARTGLA
jgi:hypothetical protein